MRAIVASITLLAILIPVFGLNRQAARVSSPAQRMNQTGQDKQYGEPSPVVNKYGALTNLKDAQGKLLFDKPLREGFTLRYRAGQEKEQLLYVYGESISDPKADCDYCKKINGAGLTTALGLNITSSFFFDSKTNTLRATRTISNRSPQKVSFLLSEVKHQTDSRLIPFSSRLGRSRPVFFGTDNCWPCLPPGGDCLLSGVILNSTQATIVCPSCDGESPTILHSTCSAYADEELQRAKAETHGCENAIILQGVDARQDRLGFFPPCPGDIKLPPKALSRLLMLRHGESIALITKYKLKWQR